jgi:molybdenum transport protein
MDWCEQIKGRYPPIAVLAAGGIRPDNVENYALSGVDGLVLSSVYHAPPADLEVRIVAI